MIVGWIAGMLLKRGIGKTLEGASRIAKIGLVVALVLGLVTGGCLWLRSHDRAVVEADDLKESEAAAKRDLRGERSADAAIAEGEKSFTAGQAKIKEEQDAAVAKDPEGARRPVGPSSRGYYDSLPK
jgi:uncharacterized protein HemX